jgi:cellulose synthase/poly-beta-1,6-N-acetylglucosamine synthase-like glycosyltransferase
MYFTAILFWFCLLLTLYVYLGYPLLIAIIGSLFKSNVKKGNITPGVSLIISAFNEEKIIAEKLNNTLDLNYSGEIEVIVASDCSTDATDDIVREYSDKGIVLNRIDKRQGKTLALNQTLPKATGEIIVFSDANAMYEPDAIEKLVRNFNDQAVGCVSGESRYVTSVFRGVIEQEKRYWQYERFLKIRESRLGSLVGADGAIFAVRRELCTPMIKEDINDFIIPLRIVAKGWRAVYEKDAIAYEHTVSTAQKGFRQKARIVNRSCNGFFKVKELLNPFKYGFFAVQLVSHKVLRWLSPFFMILMFLSNLLLLSHGAVYQLVFVPHFLFYFAALLGLLTRSRAKWAKLFYACYYFFLMNLASLIGVLKYLFGKVETTWEPSRD